MACIAQRRWTVNRRGVRLGFYSRCHARESDGGDLSNSMQGGGILGTQTGVEVHAATSAVSAPLLQRLDKFSPSSEEVGDNQITSSPAFPV